jgi:hypothetical protein
VGRAARLGGRIIVAFGGLLARLGVEPPPMRSDVTLRVAGIEHSDRGWRVMVVGPDGERGPDSPWFATEAEAQAFAEKTPSCSLGRSHDRFLRVRAGR